MTTTGIIIISVLSILTFILLIKLGRDVFWNLRLRTHYKNNAMKPPKVSFMFWIKRSYGVTMSALFVFALVISNTFQAPFVINDRTYVNAMSVGSESNLKSIIHSQQQGTGSLWDRLFPTQFDVTDDAMAPGAPESSTEEDNRDFIGTNVQVDGVDEADILKTDGTQIFFAARYFNYVRVLDIDSNGLATLNREIALDEFSVDGLYLTDAYLVVVGYTYEYTPYKGELDMMADVWIEPFYMNYTGTIRVYDRTTYEEVYEMKTDGSFHNHRLIDNTLFFVSNHSIYDDGDLRPTYHINQGDDVVTDQVDYEDIYYFPNMPIQGMTVVTGLKLGTFEKTSEAFLGYADYIYANNNQLFTAFNYYDYVNDYKQYVHIVQYDLDSETATVSYVGQGRVDGGIQSQYWMDSYDGHFRIVTTTWNPIKNQLFVLRASETEDQLEIVGSITEGLGKPNETVKSVRYNEDLAYVVTFVNMDPLYTISLANPENPMIISFIEEPGFSTYLHVWGQDNHLIGFGVDEFNNVKISAYDTNFDEPLDTYQMVKEDQANRTSYSYSEALWNPKAILVDAEKNIFAFPVNAYRYFITANEYGNYYEYISSYYIFSFDFSKENPEDIIGEPIIINHDPLDYYSGIERGTWISTSTKPLGIIYTFSFSQMISYDLSVSYNPLNPTYYQKIDFQTE
ncbi:MAG: hypothetical protein CVV61_01815 [Tenericutes bacterium HGW-Tenericutes-6]|nr:MAG: hypothetical protein CVV61_01815 [Tenericutes bacterium HGW-Tenericutes-6]